MVANRFIGCNIFFRFIKGNKTDFFNSTKTVTTIVPITKLRYIEHEHSTNKTLFCFDNGTVEIIPEIKEGIDVLKDIEKQINNGYNFIDIKEP